ncbi:MAG: hypothetical protein Tsb0020_32990 [Haliangiales bacterium]
MSSAASNGTVARRVVTASSAPRGDDAPAAFAGGPLTFAPETLTPLPVPGASFAASARPIAAPPADEAPSAADPGADASAGSAEPVASGSSSRDQLELARRSLERRIRAHIARGSITLTLTDNRYTMISVRREGEPGRGFKVRLHHMFVDADPAITRALARYITHNDRDASRLLGEYIECNQHQVRSRSRRALAPRLTVKGRYHDLQDIYDDLNRRYFGGRIEARITWGQRNRKPRRRNSIKMGSYSVEDRLIRIHRSLDRAFVPRFFVEWIVYHEMLHQVHEIKVVNGRRQFHTRAFLRDEAKFEHYAEARRWERQHLDALLTC